MLAFFLTFLGVIVVLLLIGLLLIRLLISVVTVSGTSMSSSLNPGDRILILCHWPTKWLRREQIVVGRLSPALPSPALSSQEFFVKRIIGLPEDTVRIHISELPEIMHKNRISKCDSNGELVWRVPAGHCFVRGDAPLSVDSVVWGPIQLNLIVGVFLAKLPRRTRVHGKARLVSSYKSWSLPELENQLRELQNEIRRRTKHTNKG